LREISCWIVSVSSIEHDICGPWPIPAISAISPLRDHVPAWLSVRVTCLYTTVSTWKNATKSALSSWRQSVCTKLRLFAKLPTPFSPALTRGNIPFAKMYSTLQRLNHLSSLATTYIMILLSLISIASFLLQPTVHLGKIDIKDLIMLVLPFIIRTIAERVSLLSPIPPFSLVFHLPSFPSRPRPLPSPHSQRGRLRHRWGAIEEELASLRFDVRADLNPLLNSYNTKQLFLYLTATYSESSPSPSPSPPDLSSPDSSHEVVLWDRIITRGDMRDFRAVGKSLSRATGGKRGRGNVRVEEGKNKYQWKNPSGSFRCVAQRDV